MCRASAEFLQGESKKISRRGGQKHTFCLNNTQKILFKEKSKNTPFLACQKGGGERAPLPPSGRPWKPS